MQILEPVRYPVGRWDVGRVQWDVDSAVGRAGVPSSVGRVRPFGYDIALFQRLKHVRAFSVARWRLEVDVGRFQWDFDSAVGRARVTPMLDVSVRSVTILDVSNDSCM